MTGFDTLLFLVYAICSLGLLAYGLNCYVLVYHFFRNRGVEEARNRAFLALPARQEEDWPRVTTQLPVFNERYVVERLLRAAAAMDYPAGRHEIQLLDDSDDDTTGIAARVIEELVANGVSIRHLRRAKRTGFKAGALNHGLEHAAGDLLAIFDADFIPEPDFLLRTVPFFHERDRVAMVQTRWGHANRAYSLLTRALAVGIDGHFVIEQGARTWRGLFMNFNGTAGIWNRTAIVDAGGWQSDTLTEDLDLSYRAQLRGWRMKYLQDVVTPSELPVDINGLKSQQYRWAKGSIQVARKMLPEVFRAEISWQTKVQAYFHLTHYLIHPLIVAVAVLALPVFATFARLRIPAGFLVASGCALTLAAISPSVLYFCSQRAVYPDWRRRVWVLPALVAIGVGIAVNNSRAVIEALLGRQTSFIRTPKYGLLDQANRKGTDAGRRRTYTTAPGFGIAIEVALGLYACATVWLYWQASKWEAIPLLVLNAIGFTVVGTLSISHWWRSRPVV